MITKELQEIIKRSQNMKTANVTGFYYANPLKMIAKNSTHKLVRTIYKDDKISETGILKFGNKNEICQYFDKLISTAKYKADTSLITDMPLITKWTKSKFDVYIRGNNYSFEIKPL